MKNDEVEDGIAVGAPTTSKAVASLDLLDGLDHWQKRSVLFVLKPESADIRIVHTKKFPDKAKYGIRIRAKKQGEAVKFCEVNL